jgi:hypothetical protein
MDSLSPAESHSTVASVPGDNHTLLVDQFKVEQQLDENLASGKLLFLCALTFARVNVRICMIEMGSLRTQRLLAMMKSSGLTEIGVPVPEEEEASDTDDLLSKYSTVSALLLILYTCGNSSLIFACLDREDFLQRTSQC